MTKAPICGEESNGPSVIHWQDGSQCCDEKWEQSYASFETSEEEIRKFKRRFRQLGINSWQPSLHIVELFCGRGNGLKSLGQIGFFHLEGVDLSASLLQQFRGRAQLYVGDCRQLEFPDESKDAVIVQGGLHHLPVIPDDLELVLSEASRILKPNGRIVIVEPWLTPFLKIVHAACNQRLVRKAWPKMDALHDMIEQERETYEQWLRKPSEILRLLDKFFLSSKRSIAFGKIRFVGTRRKRV